MKFQPRLTKTYGTTVIDRLENDRWAATHWLRERNPDDHNDSGSYVRVVALSEEMAQLRLIQALGELLASKGYEGVYHG